MDRALLLLIEKEENLTASCMKDNREMLSLQQRRCTLNNSAMRHDRALLDIALDLTSSLTGADRYTRLLSAVRRAIPCDAAALLRLDGDELVPLAAHGLTPEALGHRFHRRQHPRLDVILRERSPVRFPVDTSLPDPFDGFLKADPHALTGIHACLGCALVEGDEVVGALTADALAPNAFDHLDQGFLTMLGALAGAALKTTALIEALERIAERHSLVARDLQRVAAQQSGTDLIGTSAAIEKVRNEIDLVASSDFSVLILGETGVGKEVVARAVHAASARRDEPLIYVNCAALPESLAEAELFGHVRGAFTGATRDRPGKFDVADGGTLLLDEVGELPRSVQTKLLRALQAGEIQRVGSDESKRVDVRVLAATNRHLEKEVERGRFRRDLYHRLAVYPITVPPLRERSEDIPLLAGYFLDGYRRRLGLGPVRLSERAREALERSPWPGNVRELDHLLGRAVLRAKGKGAADRQVVVDVPHLDLTLDEPTLQRKPEADRDGVLSGGTAGLREAVDEYRRTLIRDALSRTDGNWAAAARLLGLDRSNLHHLARRLGLIRKLE
jgi:anaerobic nitric oxide reductase transcription regulator